MRRIHQALLLGATLILSAAATGATVKAVAGSPKAVAISQAGTPSGQNVRPTDRKKAIHAATRRVDNPRAFHPTGFSMFKANARVMADGKMVLPHTMNLRT